MKKNQNNEQTINTNQKLKANIKLEYKNKEFVDSMVMQIKNEQIGLNKYNETKQITTQQNKTGMNIYYLYLKFINILSVAKNCKTGDQFKIIIFSKGDEQDQQEFQDEDQQNVEQCLQLQILSQLSNNPQKIVQIKGRFVLTLSFCLNSLETKQIKSEKVSNMEQLERKIKEGQQRSRILALYQKIYQKIVTKLNEIDASAKQQNGNNNKSIFNLLNSQNNEKFEQMADQENEENEWLDQEQIQDELQEKQNR